MVKSNINLNVILLYINILFLIYSQSNLSNLKQVENYINSIQNIMLKETILRWMYTLYMCQVISGIRIKNYLEIEMTLKRSNTNIIIKQKKTILSWFICHIPHLDNLQYIHHLPWYYCNSDPLTVIINSYFIAIH